MERFRVRASGDDGFSLIELLVVIIIIGILAGIAIPVFLSQRTKGSDASVKTDLRNLATGEESYFTENKTYSSLIGDLTLQGSQLSAGNAFSIAGTSAHYCAVGSNAKSTTYYVLDSTSGGLKTTRYASLASAKAATGCAADTWAGSLT